MSFTIVVPFFNGYKYLDRLFNSIPDSIPVILVDDKSDRPPSVGRPNVRVLNPQTKGYFTGAVNSGIEACNTDVLILNQDTYFTGQNWLNFIDQKKERYGIFGERAGAHPAWPKRYVHGTFMYIRRDVIKALGRMDAINYPHWGSTCEYQLRACRKGFKVLPVENVPDFVHLRRGPYGSATKEALITDRRNLLIRTPPYVSIIITCYNYGRFLKDAVNSLTGGKTSLGRTRGQTFQGFEIIIVDDGSTDDSVEIAEKLASPWQGIHFVSQTNRGSASAMNTGIKASHARSGHLIAPLDADDMMKPERLERMIQVYEENPHSVIYDNLQYFAYGKEGVVTSWETGKRYETLDLGNYNFDEIINKNTMHKGLLYPRQAWEEVGGYPEIMTQGREDWAFNVGLGIKGWCGINTGEFEYLYRRELQNRTLQNTTPKWRSKFHSQLRSLYPNIYAGERPMGCCGGGKRTPKAASRGRDMTAKRELPGKQGMITLEYNGGNAGNETWRGPVTSTVYIFGGSRRRGYVDIRDANGDPEKRIEGMLSIKENGRQVFREIKPVVRKQRAIEKPVTVFNPSRFSVAVVKDKLSSLSALELELVLQKEKEGKGRTTAIAAIEGALNERLA